MENASQLHEETFDDRTKEIRQKNEAFKEKVSKYQIDSINTRNQDYATF
jgi:hypothetical protein